MPQTQQFSEIPDFQSAWNTGGDAGHTEQEGAFVTDFPQDFGNDFVATGQDGQGFGTDWPDSGEGERERGKKDKKEKKKKDKLGWGAVVCSWGSVCRQPHPQLDIRFRCNLSTTRQM